MLAAPLSKRTNRRFNTDVGSSRIVHAPTVRIAEQPVNGINPQEVADALTSGGKGKKLKAYRRSDSAASVGGGRSRGHTKELALPPDDSLMCPPSFLTGLKPDLSIRDGTRLELKVAVKGDPDPQVTWTKDGKPIVSSEIMEVKYKNGTASVTINEVFPEDGGKYTCRAHNTKGSVETSCRVTVLPMEKKATAAVNGSSASAAAGMNGTASHTTTAAAPRVIDHVKSQTVKDGDAVTLTCNIGGAAADRFDVIWLHNEKEIKPSKDFEYKSSGNLFSLVIHEIFPEDGGTYTCEAFNDIGECFSSCSLVVEVPGEDSPAPKFGRFPVSFTAERGSAASFEAELLSGPPASVLWTKDGREIREQAMKYRMTAKGNRLGLDILECSTADAGQYAVLVTNKKGEAKAAFSLNV